MVLKLKPAWRGGITCNVIGCTHAATAAGSHRTPWGLQARLALGGAGIVPVHRGVDRHRLLDSHGERVVAVRLFDEVERAVLQRVDRHRDVAVATQEQHRVAQPARHQFFVHAQARHGLHADVEQEHAGQRPGGRVDRGQQGRAGGMRAHVEPARGEHEGDGVEHGGFVIEQVDDACVGAGAGRHTASAS